MSIRSTGTVLSCLQHSYRSARRSPWAPLPAAVIPLSSLSSKRSTHSERIFNSTASPSTDHPDSNAEAGVGEANLIPTPLGHTWFVSRKDRRRIRRRRHLDVRLEQYDSSPWAPSTGDDEIAAFTKTIWMNSLNYPYRPWSDLYCELAFPEDGDFSRARKSMASYQFQATKLLALSQKSGGLPPTCKMKHLAPFLIGALAESAKSTLHLMNLMEGVSDFDFIAKVHCLLYLSIAHWSEIETEPGLRERYDGEIDKVAVSTEWPTSMPKSALLAMLKHSSFQRCQEIIDSVLAAYDPVPPELLLIMVDYYTKQELPDDAIAMLARIPLEDLKRLGESVHGRYFNLIKLDNVERSDSGLNFKILPRLLEIGLPLTDDMQCDVIARAVKLGLPDVAWEVYHFMEANEMTVNAHGHLVLLRDSFQRGDLDGLNLIMSNIYQRKDLVRDRYLVSYAMNIVRYVCYFERQLPVTESLAHVLAVYDRAYDRAPLVKLALVDPLPPNGTDATLPQPDAPALSFALWTYVLIQRSDHHVWHFWHHFTHLVASGEQDMCDVARHDVLYNGLIIYWGRKKETLLNAVEVLEEMERLGFCTPTELTWVFLISAFLKHGQEASAERIRRMMIAKGVKTDPDNWLWLLKEYSESNLVVRVKHELEKKTLADRKTQSSVLDWEKLDMLRAPV